MDESVFSTCPKSSAASPGWTRIARQSWLMAGWERLSWQSSVVPQPLLMLMKGRGSTRRHLGMLKR